MLKEIGQVAVFIICAQTLLHFRAKESYEKYIKLLISMMVLLILMSPFLEWGGGNEEYSFVEEVKEYEQALGRSLLLSAPEEKAVEEVLQSMVEE